MAHPYCTAGDIADRTGQLKLVQLLDDERLASTAQTYAAALALNAEIGTRLDSLIEDASIEIDTYIRSRYATPLDSVPTSIRRRAVDVAVYYLHLRRSSEFDAPESVIRIWEYALRWLRDAGAAKVDLGIEPVPAISDKQAEATQVAETVVFGADDLSDF